MPISHYRRPAACQVKTVYRCVGCSHEVETDYGAPRVCPYCGGNYVAAGESWPADASEWDESRENVNDEWRNERRTR